MRIRFQKGISITLLRQREQKLRGQHGTTAQNFTSSVIAEDSTTENYIVTVTVTIAPAPPTGDGDSGLY
ncbi:hypothetical protein [Paenibacillus macquariensis]|uniref:Uncharacterized protein n=1 Tax=Paenibacillus macquariensis TaxID=948756 RepID=A0ABY1JNM5_9BACL|nr:hypothetical protein [Paenibacillus macquariensis]MEC0092149.1 hypothetical protein [Paenibacillus macquariensis]OAB37297.1 hypothetical protein PMSM_04275 [Paenibacillus macquariensis subsp. macquariensis]SIQ50161.1 hypothetical protein SAMN05421578_102280 [Paenibacillus macquariensis]